MNTLRLGATQTLIDAIDDARSVHLEAYVLGNPRLIDALERAAKRGADVDVSLCGDPVGEPRVTKENAQTISALQKHGVNVHVELGEGPDSLHTKAAMVDDQLFLDDRNWTEATWETVIRDDRPEDVAAWREGKQIAGLAWTKTDAIRAEADVIEHARGKDLLIATESLGPGPVADALILRARAGDRVRVLYNPDLHISGKNEIVRALRAAGAQLRSTHQSHKIAFVGDAAWIGSANATQGGPERDWGMTLHGELAQRLGEIAERTWDAAHPLMHGYS